MNQRHQKSKIKKLTSDSVGASCPKDSFMRSPIAPPFPTVFPVTNVTIKNNQPIHSEKIKTQTHNSLHKGEKIIRKREIDVQIQELTIITKNETSKFNN